MTAAEWRSRASREAAAIIAGAYPNTSVAHYPEMINLVAIGWLQGVSYGTHETMRDAEAAFDRLREDLLR